MLIFDSNVGVDEAGRGPWAGPLVVAAVKLHKSIPQLNDSKMLKEKTRELLFPIIKENATFSIVVVSAFEIDNSNILKATLNAMQKSALAILEPGLIVRVDGNKLPHGLPEGSEAVVKGDGKVQAIAAASILAKVTRDHYMIALDEKYPHFGFSKHKGYGTKAHMEALAQVPPCPEHRFSYAPIKKWVEHHKGS